MITFKSFEQIAEENRKKKEELAKKRLEDNQSLSRQLDLKGKK